MKEELKAIELAISECEVLLQQARKASDPKAKKIAMDQFELLLPHLEKKIAQYKAKRHK